MKKILFVFLSLCLIFTECFAEEIDVFKLAEKGTPKQLKEALKKGAKFNVERNINDFDNLDEDYWPDYYWPFDTGETPLHRAAACNHNTKSIRFLIEQGLDVNAIASIGLNASLDPLACSLWSKNTVAAKELLRNGADPNAWTVIGFCFSGTPFHIVASVYDDNSRDIIKALINAGGNINIHEELSPEEVTEPEFIEYKTIFLPRNQWDDDDPCGNMRSFSYAAAGNLLATLTPLMWAVIYDNAEVVDTLLDFKADVHIRSVENKTAIDYANDLPENSKIKKSSAFKRLILRKGEK